MISGQTLNNGSAVSAAIPASEHKLTERVFAATFAFAAITATGVWVGFLGWCAASLWNVAFG
ncbi:hypothetical protein [Terrarubrum flagellatum]|uniref:hypothetical protein n=1 Tax=Terrirubrum flagellatum TaxID=2895980 RepID=UPI003144D91E